MRTTKSSRRELPAVTERARKIGVIATGMLYGATEEEIRRNPNGYDDTTIEAGIEAGRLHLMPEADRRAFLKKLLEESAK